MYTQPTFLPSIHPFKDPLIQPTTHPSVSKSVCLCLPNYLSTYWLTCPSVCPSFRLSSHPSIHPSTYAPMYVPTYAPMYVPTTYIAYLYLSVYIQNLWQVFHYVMGVHTDCYEKVLTFSFLDLFRWHILFPLLHTPHHLPIILLYSFPSLLVSYHRPFLLALFLNRGKKNKREARNRIELRQEWK